ncbi:BatA domain-containing protein [Lysobacter sp. S4-A87]|uniref:BatA domain-containing protein n=1 Tax=Lysobacter sp. S4-A87 TaxID=2925843 RepID=UPI001F536570|nr:BatA domain-containing protein [Lysobacter sp. S4-A87]UNK47900.1 BatA domain-containing protein [Lysobacter sp. S4-A87]
MSLAFLLPAGLAALAALLLPLLIHLARRSEQRPIQFAALRWLRQKPKPRHRIRFDEWLLLALRLLLLIALALLLARPVIVGGASDAPWIAVVPGVDLQQARAQPAPENARWHWLAPGFPSLDEPAPRASAPVISLLRELDADLPAGATLTVLVPEQLSGVDAQLPSLSHRIQWRVLPGSMPTGPAQPNVAAFAPSIRHAPQREAAMRYLRAAQAAWSAGNTKAASDQAPHTQPLPANTRQLIWLAPGPLPAAVDAWAREGGVALLDHGATMANLPATTVLWRDATGAPLVEGAAYGKGRVMRFTRELAPQAMPALLEPDFPQQLRTLFDPPRAAPTRVLAATHAPLAGGPVFPQSPRDLQPWLVLLIAVLFLAERWLATGARRTVAP